MKKNVQIILLALISSGFFGLLESCNESPVKPIAESPHISPLKSGEKIYYSRNADNGEIYQMKIKQNEDGIISIDRKVSNGEHNGQDITTSFLFGDNVLFESTDNTVTIPVPADKVLFLIPFNPSQPAYRLPTGGFTRSCFCTQTSSGANNICNIGADAISGATCFKGGNCIVCQMLTIANPKFSTPDTIPTSAGGDIIVEAIDITEN